MFCPYCGAQVRDDAAFCNRCRRRLRSAEGTVSGKEELIADLTKSEAVIKKWYSILESITEIDKKISVLKKKNPGVMLPALLHGAVFLISILVLLIFGRGDMDLGIRLLVFGLIPQALLIVFDIYYIKKKKARQKNRNGLDLYTLEQGKNGYAAELSALMNSEDGRTARRIVPKDYFYPEAVKKLLSYLRNGHADSMKDALREYDQYRYRCRLEYETKRTADASGRSARASRRAARASEQNAEYARVIEQWKACTNFWRTMNHLNLKKIRYNIQGQREDYRYYVNK